MHARSLPLLIAASSTAFFMSASSSLATRYQVYLIGGQSNGTGRGDASKLTGPLAKPQPDVRFYWHRTMKAENVGHLLEDQWIALAPGSGHGMSIPVNPKEFGCEVSFGRAMADAHPDAHIANIKYTHGGTSLKSNWNAKGLQYAAFVSTVQAGLNALTAAGDTFELCGMLWDQGENDAGSAASAKKYESNLTELVSRVRKDVAGGANLPFVIGGLSNSQDKSVETPGTPWFLVRQAQENVAKDIINGGFVNTDGYTTRSGEAIHFDHAGQVALGQAFAAEMLRIEKKNAGGK